MDKNEIRLEIKSSPAKINIWLLGIGIFPALIIVLSYYAFDPKELQMIEAKIFVISLAILTGFGSFLAYISAKKYLLLITEDKFIEKTLFKKTEISYSDYYSVSVTKEAGFYVAKLYRNGENTPKKIISVFAKMFVEFPYFIQSKLLDRNKIEADMEVKIIEEAYGKKIDEKIENKFKLVRKLVIPINGLAFLSTIMAIYRPYYYHVLMLTLIVIPIIGVLLMKKYPNQMTFDISKKSRFISAQWIIMLPIIALMYRSGNDWNVEEYTGVGYSIIIFVALAYFPLLKTFKTNNKIRDAISLLIVIVMYSLGSSIYINCHYDKSQPELNEFEIVNFKISNGKNTKYYVVVKNWDKENSQKEISVSGDVYKSLNYKSKLKVEFRNGLLGSKWFVIKNTAT